MKTIGLLCGLSWLSTKIYYEIINTKVSKKLGNHNSAHLIMNSVNAQLIISLLNDNRFKEIEKFLIQSCRILEDAGCDFIGITCNTLHYFFENIQAKISIPIMHIMDSVTKRLAEQNIKKIGILATGYTTKFRLYDAFLERLNITSVYPDVFSIKTINDVIFKKVRNEVLTPKDQKLINNICVTLEQQNIQGIILGCTELQLIVNDYHALPLFNSASIHAEDLTYAALGGNIVTANKTLVLADELYS